MREKNKRALFGWESWEVLTAETFELRPEGSGGASQAKRKGKSFLGGRNNLCKCHEARRSLGTPRTEVTSVAGARLKTWQGSGQVGPQKLCQRLAALSEGNGVMEWGKGAGRKKSIPGRGGSSQIGRARKSRWSKNHQEPGGGTERKREREMAEMKAGIWAGSVQNMAFKWGK